MTPADPDSDLAALEARISELRRASTELRASVGELFLGHRDVLDQVLFCLLADGHVLLESAPGLGKTTLVRTVASALDLSFSRVQFTPDLMPADIIGTRVLEEDADGRRRFTFHEGPLFANVVLADEINRATPRTQSALLEAMQERQITVFGESHRLEEPFCVIATQNPIEMEGTYPLPEAQLDRFLAKLEIPAPGERELVSILQATTGPATEEVRGGLGRADLLELRRIVRQLPASSDVVQRVARLICATRPDADEAPERVRTLVRYGASPRGGQAILLLAKARALLAGRMHVSDEDVDAVAAPALRHRLVLSYEGEASGVSPDELVADALARAS